jgi:hypothetical protein
MFSAKDRLRLRKHSQQEGLRAKYGKRKAFQPDDPLVVAALTTTEQEAREAGIADEACNAWFFNLLTLEANKWQQQQPEKPPQ